MKLADLMQLIKEELEVVLTNEEAGDLFGEDTQRRLEEDEASEEKGGFFDDSAAEESAEAATGASEEETGDVEKISTSEGMEEAEEDIRDVHGETVANQIQHLLDTETIHPEDRAFYEDFLQKHIERTRLAVAKRTGGV